MRRLDVVVRVNRPNGRLVGRTDETRVRRVSVVVLDGRGMQIVGLDAQPAKVVRRTLVTAILRVLQTEARVVGARRDGGRAECYKRPSRLVDRLC